MGNNEESVNHPSHYNQYSGFEVIDVCEQLRAPDGKGNFNRGNAFKYLSRAGWKNPEKQVEDLKKAIFYIQREIDRITPPLTGPKVASITPEDQENGDWVVRCNTCQEPMAHQRTFTTKSDSLGNSIYYCPQGHGVRLVFRPRCVVCDETMREDTTEEFKNEPTDRVFYCYGRGHGGLVISADGSTLRISRPLKAKLDEYEKITQNFFCVKCDYRWSLDTTIGFKVEAPKCRNGHGPMALGGGS